VTHLHDVGLGLVLGLVLGLGLGLGHLHDVGFAFDAKLAGGLALSKPLCYVRLGYVMVPLLPPVNCVEDSWGWWLHATSASGRRAPATEHICQW
jgi:hypothetical protein